MMEDRLLHCSALLMLNFRDRDPQQRAALIKQTRALTAGLKRRYEKRPARGYRDEEPATGVFFGYDAEIGLSRLMRERGFEFPEGHEFEDARRDVCFQLKYAPGRVPSSDPRGTRFEIIPCEITGPGGEAIGPLRFFHELRAEIVSWREGSGSPLFDPESEVFLIGARPLPMIEMFAGLQPHDFLDAFPQPGVTAVQPQSDNLLFVQLLDEKLSSWNEAGGASRRRAMGGLFTSRVLAPGDSYSLEFQDLNPEHDPSANSVFVEPALVNDPMGLGYICRIHDGFTPFEGDPPYRISMRDSFLPGIERPDIVSRFCPLRESELGKVRFNSTLDHIRLTRGGITILEVPDRRCRVRATGDAGEGLIVDANFDPDIPKLTVRLPFLFFPDIELPSKLLSRSVVVEWANEHREEARHTISFQPPGDRSSHRAQCLRALAGRLVVNAHYLSSGRARAGMDNILVYRDDFHLETAKRLIKGAAEACRPGSLTKSFNSVFTGRTPRSEDALRAFSDMMKAMLGEGDDARPGSGGIAPFVATRYSLVFREPSFD